MNNINETIKTNGYAISDKMQSNINCWKEYLSSRLNVREFRFFYYGDRLVFADCILETSGHYGSFNITEKRISFNGYTCSMDEMTIFGHATFRDECYDGRLSLVG